MFAVLLSAVALHNEGLESCHRTFSFKVEWQRLASKPGFRKEGVQSPLEWLVPSHSCITLVGGNQELNARDC